MLAQHLQAPAKRSRHFNVTDRNIAGSNMLHAFGHPVATCCDMLRVENRTSAHALAQHCCTNLAKRLQYHATSTKCCMKNLTIFKFEPTTSNNKVAKRTQHVALNNVVVALKCCERLAGA